MGASVQGRVGRIRRRIATVTGIGNNTNVSWPRGSVKDLLQFVSLISENDMVG